LILWRITIDKPATAPAAASLPVAAFVACAWGADWDVRSVRTVKARLSLLDVFAPMKVAAAAAMVLHTVCASVALRVPEY
jgi:hypothetical protein